MFQFLSNIIERLKGKPDYDDLECGPLVRAHYEEVKQYLHDTFWDGSFLRENADLYKLAEAEMRAIEALYSKERNK